MTTDALRDTVNARSFRPFIVHMAGRSLEVTHPEQMVFPHDGVSAIILTRDGQIHIQDAREINGVELRHTPRKQNSA